MESNSLLERRLCQAFSLPWLLVAVVAFATAFGLRVGAVEWINPILAGVLFAGMGVQMFRMKRSAMIWLAAVIAFLLFAALRRDPATPVDLSPPLMLALLGFLGLFPLSAWYLFRMRRRGLLT